MKILNIRFLSLYSIVKFGIILSSSWDIRLGEPIKPQPTVERR